MFGNVGNTDQRSKIETFNIAPTYTRIVGNNSVFNFGAFVRRDDYNYYPSNNPLADLGPANLQTSSIAQNRTLTECRAAHRHLLRTAASTTSRRARSSAHLPARERQPGHRRSPTFNAPCVDVNGNPLPGYTDPRSARLRAWSRIPTTSPVLAPYDFTRGGGSTTTSATPILRNSPSTSQDQIKAGNWLQPRASAATSTTG